MKESWSEQHLWVEEELEILGGNNFLVSAIVLLKKQKRELEKELQGLTERVQLLEGQNAAFMNVSADRLLEKLG
jgi:hypothetical protein